MQDRIIAKVAGIVAMVFGGLWCLTIIGALLGIPLLIGGSRMIDFSKMEDEEFEKYKTQFLIWSVFFLFFAPIAGILALIYYASLYFDVSRKPNMNYIDEIEALKKLYDEKAITKEEFETRKKEILEKEGK